MKTYPPHTLKILLNNVKNSMWSLTLSVMTQPCLVWTNRLGMIRLVCFVCESAKVQRHQGIFYLVNVYMITLRALRQ